MVHHIRSRWMKLDMFIRTSQQVLLLEAVSMVRLYFQMKQVDF